MKKKPKKEGRGAALRLARLGMLLTQAELGELLHVTDTTVTRWECGHNWMMLTTYRKLQALLVKRGLSKNAVPFS
jgi:transcriptional regulator with XRE-family HTH domain